MMKYCASARETFDQIALNLYGDEKYASVLVASNPLLCHKIMMDGGEILLAPELTAETAKSTLPPWKRGE